MMMGIVYATRREAEPFLSKITAEPLATAPFLLFQKKWDDRPDAITVISGMGKVAATIASTHLVLIYGVSMLVSAGLCGRLIMQNRRDVGDLFRISTAIEGDCDRFGQPAMPVACDTGWFGELKPARLVTSDRPVFDSTRRAQMADIGDLADMEGAAVARVAGLYGIPCAMIKGISDAADENGRKDVASHIDWVSGRIADALIRALAKDTTDDNP